MKDHHGNHRVSRHDNHHGSGRRDCREGRCRLDVADRLRFHRVEEVLLDHQCLEDAEDHCHLGEAGRYHRDEGDHCHLGVGVRCRPDAEGRCHLLDVVDHRDVGVRLDVMNCLDLGVRSWKAESAGDRGR